MLALNIYNTFYGQNANARGTAQAKAVLFFILVAAIGLIQLSATRKKGGPAVMKTARYQTEKQAKGALTIFFSVLCVFYVMPVLLVLLNSFKAGQYVCQDRIPLRWPHGESFAG